MDQDTREFAASEQSLASEKTVRMLKARYYDFLKQHGVEVDFPDTAADNLSPEADRRKFNIMKHQLVVMELAAKKCRYDGLEADSSEREDLRLHIFRLLWIGDLWRSPWNDLVYREFPGDHIGPEDMAAERASAELMSEEMLRLLEAGGYGQAGNTRVITYELSLLVLTNENRRKPDPPLALRYQAKEIIRGDTARWYDEAWSAVLNKYFPKK